MANQFSLAFKSTIDKLGNDLAVSKGLKLIDLDDLVAVEKAFGGNLDLLVWEFLSFSDSPRDPLYSFMFRIGARTLNDAANYSILSLLDDVKGLFPVLDHIEIKDYSGGVAGPKLGTFTPTDVRVDPQQFDRQHGVRMVAILGVASRDI